MLLVLEKDGTITFLKILLHSIMCTHKATQNCKISLTDFELYTLKISVNFVVRRRAHTK
jgi:hypothetical protein